MIRSSTGRTHAVCGKHIWPCMHDTPVSSPLQAHSNSQRTLQLRALCLWSDTGSAALTLSDRLSEEPSTASLPPLRL
jgi:hypothetical protein